MKPKIVDRMWFIILMMILFWPASLFLIALRTQYLYTDISHKWVPLSSKQNKVMLIITAIVGLIQIFGLYISIEVTTRLIPQAYVLPSCTSSQVSREVVSIMNNGIINRKLQELYFYRSINVSKNEKDCIFIGVFPKKIGFIRAKLRKAPGKSTTVIKAYVE